MASESANAKIWSISTLVITLALSTFVSSNISNSEKAEELKKDLAVAVTNISYIKEDSQEVLVISKANVKELLDIKQKYAILELKLSNLEETLKELKGKQDE